MDKNSIQEYGWIIIIIIVLAILIAFASPFGHFIVTSVQNTMQHLPQSAITALDSIEPLSAPQNINVKDEVLTFDPVAKATGYTIKVGDGEPFNIDSTTVNISDKLAGLEGEVAILVSAFNDKETCPAAEYVYLVPGLYATGSNYTDLIASWNELVANGVVTITDGAVYSGYDEDTYENLSSDALAGDLALPAGGEITSFADNAFVACYELTGITIPNTVTRLGYCALAYSTSITEITIPTSVTFIDEDAFDYMYIENVYYEGSLEQWCQIEFANFNSNPCYYCPLYCNGELIVDVTLPETMTTLTCAFSGCSSLKSVVIPKTITSISDAAFRNCNGLEYVSLPNTITCIGEEAFAYCESLKEIILPDSVSSIGYGAFTMTGVTEIIIPDGITAIADHLFADCRELSALTIPDSVVYVGDRSFFGCEKLEKIIFKGTVEQWSNVVVIYEWDVYTNGIAIECINGTITKENVLSAPNISITGDVLTIPAVDNAQSYKLYVDGEFKKELTDTTFDLSTLGLAQGSYRINVSARADGYTSSVVTFDFYSSLATGRYVIYDVE